MSLLSSLSLSLSRRLRPSPRLLARRVSKGSIRPFGCPQHPTGTRRCSALRYECCPSTTRTYTCPLPSRLAARWALKSSVAGDIDAEAAAELKKLEKEALERLEAKKNEMAAMIAKDSE